MSLIASLALCLPSPLLAQDVEPDRSALEADFAARMSGSVLVGRFTDTTAPEGTPPAEERYTLGEVSKNEDGRWRFEAQVEYGGRSFPLALNLDVMWAGDTPVITMTDYRIPLMGSFTCRVMFYGDLYAGTWSGTAGGVTHGGHMFGRVERPARADDGAGDGDEAASAWPSFRGRDGSGVAGGHPTASTFDLQTGEGVLWKTAIDGLCHSSPVVWGDRIYLTTAVRKEGPGMLKVGLYGTTAPVEDTSPHEYRVLALDRASGEVIWDVLAWEGVPGCARHPKGSHASSTPVTNGEVVVCMFGSEGLHAFDLEGELLWSRDLGELIGGFFFNGDQWGYSSSPEIFEDRVLVQCDVLGDSFVAAYDLEDGEELWRTSRDDVPTWSTPTVHVEDGRRQVILNGFKHMGGYDVDTGAELWRLSGAGDIPVPRPIVAHGLIYLTSAHGRLAPVYAIDPDATGELDREHEAVVWHETRGGNYMQTPLVYGDELYHCNDAGILSCRDAKTGTLHYKERIGEGRSGYTASIVAADEKIYVTSEEGVVSIIAAGKEFVRAGSGELGEEAMATPAISRGTIYWRTRGHLVAIRP